MRKTELNEAVKTIITHKAEKMKSGLKPDSNYNNHIKAVLKQSNSTVSEEKVQDFVISAVDAMIYDVGQALGFTKRTRLVDDWTSHEIRQEMLNEIFA